jgi:hypothetical protein
VIEVLQRVVGHTIRGKLIVYTVCGAVVLIYAGSLAILQAERGQRGAKITSFGDAVWWAITTVTTVGYGDLSPVTTMGRLVAVASPRKTPPTRRRRELRSRNCGARSTDSRSWSPTIGGPPMVKP